MHHPIAKTLLLLAASTLLAACAGRSSGDPTLDAKRAERDSLKARYAEVGRQLKAVETWLAEHDSTVRRNLPTVVGAPLHVGRFDHFVDVHGSVKADKAAALSTLGGGRVRAIHVGVGDRVQAGQLLVGMDNDLVNEQIQQAEAAFDLARITFEKQEQLWQQKIGSEIQYLQARSQKEQAEAALATLREQERLTNITAPFGGVVDDIMVRVGDMTLPGIPVARVVDLSSAQIEADLPESYVGRVKKDAPAIVRFPSIDTTTFEAHVEHVGNFIDPANRTFKIVLHVPNGGDHIRPNLLSDISINDHGVDSALVVPSKAVLEDVNGGSYLFALKGPAGGDEATATKVLVRRVSQYKGLICVEPVAPGALKDGDVIITDGVRNVSDGQVVRVTRRS